MAITLRSIANALLPEKLAAVLLPPSADPKVPKGGGVSLPSDRKSTTPNPAQITKPRLDVANVDLANTFRSGADTATIVRNLCRVSPELAGSQAAHLRVGIPEGFICIARDADGSFNVEATRLAMQLARRMNFMGDYENGFSQVGSLRSVSEACARQLYQTGAVGMEMILDKSRLPFGFQPLSTGQIFWFEDGKGNRPVQRIGGQDIDLDIATFFYVALDPDVLDVYAQSPLESAIQPVLASVQFLTDLRRMCNRHIYKRYNISIDDEKLAKRIPAQIKADPAALAEWYDDTLSSIDDMVSDLGVDDALIHYDFIEINYIEGDSGDTPATLDSVRTAFDTKISTATKTPPGVLGQGAKSATAASTDTLLFMLNVNGMIRVKIMELYSKAFTLGVRLVTGQDVTVEFLFDEIELRPKSEIAAYRSMNQSYWRQQLSDGYITDEEYCLRTTGNLPPNGFKPRVGTYFMDSAAPQTGVANPDSQTSNLGTNSNKAPTQPKGPVK